MHVHSNAILSIRDIYVHCLYMYVTVVINGIHLNSCGTCILEERNKFKGMNVTKAGYIMTFPNQYRTLILSKLLVPCFSKTTNLTFLSVGSTNPFSIIKKIKLTKLKGKRITFFKCSPRNFHFVINLFLKLFHDV